MLAKGKIYHSTAYNPVAGMSKDEYAVYYDHVQLIYMSHDQTFGSEKRGNIFISTLFLEQLMQNRCFG